MCFVNQTICANYLFAQSFGENNDDFFKDLPIAEKIFRDIEFLHSFDSKSVTCRMIGMFVGIMGMSVILNNVLCEVGFDESHDL